MNPNSAAEGECGIVAGVQYPVGRRLPGSLHSVSCSLPTMKDVMGYEEKRPETLERVCVGYPRFLPHPLLGELAREVCRRHGRPEGPLALIPSCTALPALLEFCGLGADEVTCFELPTGAVAVALPLPEDRHRDRVRAFLQHTGWSVSSRQAEDILIAFGVLGERQPEERYLGPDPAGEAVRLWAEFAGHRELKEGIILTGSGMSAFFSAFRAVSDLQASHGRRIWVQLGWLYLDTAEILGKWADPAHPPRRFHRVGDLEEFERFLGEAGNQVAGLVTEAPSNPLLTTPDLRKLRELADRYGFILVLDPSMASAGNVDVLPFADLLTNSLTKYTGGRGDVLAGLVLVNPRSPHAPELSQRLRAQAIPPYEADLRRLVVQVAEASALTAELNTNARQVCAFLETHPAIAAVHHPLGEESRAAFEATLRPGGGPGGVFSFTLKAGFTTFYDALRLPKGPSFGVRFSLLCPFLYLAHYSLVSRPEGRAYLRSQGLEPDLIRFSTGRENPDTICGLLEEALERAQRP